jgi:hypothetical protein
VQRDLIIVDDFYDSPRLVVEYALAQEYYSPYALESRGWGPAPPAAQWKTSYWRPFEQCPFKQALPDTLRAIVGEVIDMEHWKAPYRVDSNQRCLYHPASETPVPNTELRSCRWNCSFHVKHHQARVGTGVHNHCATADTDTHQEHGDFWNGVGDHGWAGIIYLNEHASRLSGLKTWKHRGGKPRRWMGPSEEWELVDEFAPVFNRLILHRGRIPHSGGPGWGTSVPDGRLFQTFFFRTLEVYKLSPAQVMFDAG